MKNNSTINNNNNIRLGPGSADPLGFNNPTPVILALVNKFILCMLLVANSALFHTLALNKKSKIPQTFSIAVSLVFISLAFILGSFALYEYIIAINQYVTFCNNNSGCLYSSTSLSIAKYMYIFIAIMFSLTCISICGLLFKNSLSKF